MRGLVREGSPFFVKRMAQMGMAVRTEGAATCAFRGEGAARGWFAASPATTDGATGAAVLIAMAKAWDTLDGPPQAVVLCLGRGADAAAWVELGWFAAGPVEAGPPVHAGAPDPSRTPERLDYRELARQAQEVWSGATSGGR